MAKKVKIKKQRKNKYPVPPREITVEPEFISQETLDFHERGPLHLFEIENLYYEFISDVYARNRTRVLIVTGKGKVVKPQIEKLLKQDKRVRKFQKAGYFNGRDGAYEVFF